MPTHLHPIPSADQGHALDVLTGASRVILTGHVRPDGDCIGAQAALARLLESRGQQVRILNPDPPEARYDYLSDAVAYGADEGEALPEHDLIVLLDCSEISRTGALAARFEASDAQKVIVDHHVLPDEAWWDAAFHDQTASSTGLLVARIADALGWTLDPIAARGVFTSMVTDTGWFKYSNTDAETLGLASQLVSLGVDPSSMYGSIYQRQPDGHPQAVGRLLSGLRYELDGKLGLLPLPLGSDGRPQSVDTDDALDLVRSVEEIEVVLLVRQVTPNICKLSARSKTEFDVCALARGFGGGGHVKASGASIEGTLSEVTTALVVAARAQWEEMYA